jgi:hypothetical protein
MTFRPMEFQKMKEGGTLEVRVLNLATQLDNRMDNLMSELEEAHPAPKTNSHVEITTHQQWLKDEATEVALKEILPPAEE